MPSIAKLLLIVLTVAVGFFAGDLLKLLQGQTPVSLDDYCLVSTEPCTQQSVTVKANKSTSQPLVPTLVQVDWPDARSDKLVVSMQGYEMDMGNVLFTLERTATGQFSGQIILPVCTTDAMTWYGTISDGDTSINTSIRMER
ncbi:hypothetical protein EJ063_04990 [Vibrio aquaticus]|uniref:Uncharacterized protein n=1 Tax=Vibrio aquaticus TaxID=2496559 RepID=A0A3S0V544_9VIBR|nr:hypothetical protein [Vibrio aquaticus]RTZ18146.1 hypothetical protein EJ063_04990 [Vibrio aquaticus]